MVLAGFAQVRQGAGKHLYAISAFILKISLRHAVRLPKSVFDMASSTNVPVPPSPNLNRPNRRRAENGIIQFLSARIGREYSLFAASSLTYPFFKSSAKATGSRSVGGPKPPDPGTSNMIRPFAGTVKAPLDNG